MSKIIIDTGDLKNQEVHLGGVDVLVDRFVKPILAQHVVDDGRLQAALDEIGEAILRAIPPIMNNPTAQTGRE